LRWSKAKRALDALAKAAPATGASPAPLIPWSVHDLRRTLATGLQRLGVRVGFHDNIRLVLHSHDTRPRFFSWNRGAARRCSPDGSPGAHHF
jgi:hypothetical protein